MSEEILRNLQRDLRAIRAWISSTIRDSREDGLLLKEEDDGLNETRLLIDKALVEIEAASGGDERTVVENADEDADELPWKVVFSDGRSVKVRSEEHANRIAADPQGGVVGKV